MTRYISLDRWKKRTALKRDGREELILLYITACVADRIEIIYDYEEGTGSVREQFAEYPAVTHFDNGILQADWSHNQGLADYSGDAGIVNLDYKALTEENIFRIN